MTFDTNPRGSVDRRGGMGAYAGGTGISGPSRRADASELSRIPLPRGAEVTVRCTQCGEYGRDHEPACSGHREHWVFLTTGMRSWLPYTARERWA